MECMAFDELLVASQAAKSSVAMLHLSFFLSSFQFGHLILLRSGWSMLYLSTTEMVTQFESSTAGTEKNGKTSRRMRKSMQKKNELKVMRKKREYKFQ